MFLIKHAERCGSALTCLKHKLTQLNILEFSSKQYKWWGILFSSQSQLSLFYLSFEEGHTCLPEETLIVAAPSQSTGQGHVLASASALCVHQGGHGNRAEQWCRRATKKRLSHPHPQPNVQINLRKSKPRKSLHFSPQSSHFWSDHI